MLCETATIWIAAPFRTSVDEPENGALLGWNYAERETLWRVETDIVSVRVEISSEWECIARVREPWSELHRARSGGPFTSHDWLVSWTEAFRDTSVTPRIVLVWRDGMLVAAAPLAVRHRAIARVVPYPKARILGMLSDERVGFHDWLLAPGHEDTVSILGEAIAGFDGWRAIDLAPVRASGALEQQIAAFNGKGLRTMRRVENRAAVADLSQGWDAYLSARPRSFRKNLRSCAKRIEETGGRVLMTGLSRRHDDELFERALALSARCWKASAGTDITTDVRARNLMRGLWGRLRDSGGLRIHLLTVDGADLASVISLIDEDTTYGFVTDFAEEAAHLSPGRFLIAESMKQSSETGLKRYNMLRSTPFLVQFADQVIDFERIRVFSPMAFSRIVAETEEVLRPIGRAKRIASRYSDRRRPAYKT